MSALEIMDETSPTPTSTDTITTDSDPMATFFAARHHKEVQIQVVPDGFGQYVAVVTPSYFRVAQGSLCEITFTVDMSVSPPDTTFQDPPVVFFGDKAPALAMPLVVPTQAKILWSNADQAIQGRSFDYRVRLRVGDKAVVEDPTVQNDPPPPIP